MRAASGANFNSPLARWRRTVCTRTPRRDFAPPFQHQLYTHESLNPLSLPLPPFLISFLSLSSSPRQQLHLTIEASPSPLPNRCVPCKPQSNYTSIQQYILTQLCNSRVAFCLRLMSEQSTTTQQPIQRAPPQPALSQFISSYSRSKKRGLPRCGDAIRTTYSRPATRVEAVRMRIM